MAALNEEKKERLQFIFGITITIAHLNSFINAILFLVNNVKAKQYLISFLKIKVNSVNLGSFKK